MSAESFLEIYKEVNLMFGHSLRKRGVAMVEYAVLLAFVTTIGGLFMDDSKLNTAIADAIDRATYLVANGKSKPAYRYDAQTRPEDAKYKPALDSLINGLYDKLSEDGKPLKEIWINGDGSIQKYLLYDGKSWNDWHEYPDNSGPKITDYLPSDFQRDNYGGQTHLIFSEDGMIKNNNIAGSDTNAVSRVFLTGKYEPLYFSHSNQNFGLDNEYYKQ